MYLGSLLVCGAAGEGLRGVGWDTGYDWRLGDGRGVFDGVTCAAVAATGQVERFTQGFGDRAEKRVEVEAVKDAADVSGPGISGRIVRPVLFSADSRHAVYPGRRMVSEKQTRRPASSLKNRSVSQTRRTLNVIRGTEQTKSSLVGQFVWPSRLADPLQYAQVEPLRP